MIEIIPAIDIIDGRCVRLSQGDYGRSRVYDAMPLDMALRYEDAGVRRIHMVDLDGAKTGRPCNLKVLEQVASKTSLRLEWGGGIKDAEALQSAFGAGASYAVCGSIAVRDRELFRSWLRLFGGDKMVLGADIRDGKVSIGGWLEQSEVTVEELVDDFLPAGLLQVICTDISKDGMLQGPSFDLYTGLQQRYQNVDFTVSGGIGSMADIERLSDLGLRKVIVGKAIYENRITLKDIEKWSLNG